MSWPARLWAALPAWPARDWRALIALLFSIIGAAVLTFFAWKLVELLHHDADSLIGALLQDRDRALRDEIAQVLTTIIDTLSWGLKLLLAGVIAVLLSLGLAINRRTVSLSASGLNISGGEPDPAVKAAEEVAGAAAEKAAEIKADGPAPPREELPAYARN